uniref:Small ribosomal subunit protein mS39 n=1 Tax=Nothoprocta perdicaria TaxID=30464 RepID=A0A8C6YQX9_NOTPE
MWTSSCGEDGNAEMFIPLNPELFSFLQDPTAAHYMFQDDPFLMPRNTANSRLLSLAKESGRNAAKYIIKEFPQYFDKITAEPNIPCLMPEITTPQIEGVSKAALKERIHLRKVKASVDLFDQLLQAGTPVSLETTNSLLDLLCFYGDAKEEPDEQKRDLEEPETSQKRRLFLESREECDAERIFKIMPERNAHSYCTMIRGMVKLSIKINYPILFPADVHTFNALITAVPYLKEKFIERWELEFLNHMVQQEVQPNVLTFNAVLKTLRRCGGVGRSVSLSVVKEMKALDIGKRSRVAVTPVPIPKQLNKSMEKGDNWKFLDMDRLHAYWSKFFSLLCMMEQIDVVLKWYKEMTPSLFYPSPRNLLDLLQALDAANHLEVLPSVWKDIKQLGFNRRQDLMEELLSLMSRERHPEETQLAFAQCAEDIKAAHEQSGREQAPLQWSGSALGHVVVLFSRAGRTQDAWYGCGPPEPQVHTVIPFEQVMDEFLTCARQTNCPEEAIKLVELAASFGLPSTPKLKSRTEQEFDLSEKGGGSFAVAFLPRTALAFRRVCVRERCPLC